MRVPLKILLLSALCSYAYSQDDQNFTTTEDPPPLFRVVTLVQPPFVETSTDKNGKTTFKGYCIDMLEQIRAQMPYSFDYAIYEVIIDYRLIKCYILLLFLVRDKMFGTKNDQEEWNGLIAELISGQADIALAPLHVTAERERYVDFTVPFYDLVGSTVLMRKPQLASWRSLLKFFTVIKWETWICIAVVYVIMVITLYIIDIIRQCIRPSKTGNDNCLWCVVGSLTPHGDLKNSENLEKWKEYLGTAPRRLGVRLVAAFWLVLALICVASFSAYIYKPEGQTTYYNTPSRGLTDLYSSNFSADNPVKYFFIKGTATETEIKRTMPKAYKIMRENVPALYEEEAIRRVKENDNAALIADATLLKYAELTDCNLRVVGNEMWQKPYALAVQQTSPLRNDLSAAILRLLNQRELERLKEKWWNNNPNRAECLCSDDICLKEQSWNIKYYICAAIVFVIGILISVVVLLIECVCCSRSKVHADR